MERVWYVSDIHTYGKLSFSYQAAVVHFRTTYILFLSVILALSVLLKHLSRKPSSFQKLLHKSVSALIYYGSVCVMRQKR